MAGRAHLKLIVSDSPPAPAAPLPSAPPEDDGERRSLVRPVSARRLQRRWLARHAGLVALWSASAILLGLAGLIALGWL